MRCVWEQLGIFKVYVAVYKVYIRCIWLYMGVYKVYMGVYGCI